jgi:hypothetical protein
LQKARSAAAKTSLTNALLGSMRARILCRPNFALYQFAKQTQAD